MNLAVKKPTSYLTPSTADLAGPERVATNKHTGAVAFWKQILPMKSVHYTAKDGQRRTLDFTPEYLADLARMEGIDKIGFLLADKDNSHTMDPERWRGDVVKMEVRTEGGNPGLYGKVVFPNREAANAVLNNPELGVSARIREGIQRSDGSTVARGIIHVLGTLDPQVSGMAPWATADLSHDEGEMIDLSGKEYVTMTDPKTVEAPKAITDYTEEDIDKMSKDELDAFLTQVNTEYEAALAADPKAPAVVEPKAEVTEPAKEPVKEPELVGADMSKVHEDIELANSRAAFAESQAREALARLAKAQWATERTAYMDAGVPPHMLDLAAPLLEQSQDFVIDLSNDEAEDLNVSVIVRGLLDAAKGTIDMSNEAGHSGTFSGEGADPDAELLTQWANES
jgi:hypothetical protein